MDGAALSDTLASSLETELDRLGSEKSLLAATEARLETDPVLVTAAAVLATARETLDDWADAVTDDAAADGLRTGTEAVDVALESVLAELDDGEGIDDIDPPFLTLAAEGDVDRLAAGTVGLPLVLDRLFLQIVSFFVNEADERRANLFRDLRAAMDDLREDGLDALEECCESEADWERAEEAAAAVVGAAYDDYAQRLEAMGFDPKPIC